MLIFPSPFTSLRLYVNTNYGTIAWFEIFLIMFEKKDDFFTWSLGNPFCVVISFLGFEAGYTNTFNSFLVNSQ